MTEYAFEPARRGSASISWSFETQNLAADASEPFSSTIGAAFQSTVVAAFARWASVSGLVFTQVADTAQAAIRIGFGSFISTGELGETDFHYSGGIIANDTILRLLDPRIAPISLNPDGTTLAYQQFGVTLFQVLLHEIGHALGLAHTTDPATIMYPYAPSLTTDLGTGDVEGINTLYPYFTVQALDPVQVDSGTGQVDRFDFVLTRYGDPTNALTINYAVSGVADPAVAGSVAASASAFVGGTVPRGQVTFGAGSSTTTLSITTAGSSVPHPDLGFAIRLTTTNPTDTVVVRGSVNAAVLDNQGYGQISGGSLGVYRFFDDANGTHFYTTSPGERDGLILSRPDLTYEGFGLTAVATPNTDPAATPVYRFFDTSSGTHFYTASAVEQAGLVAAPSSLSYEGVAFYEHATAQTGDAAVYRFFESTDGSHFYTQSASERATILATRPDLHAEGIAFYAPVG